MTVAAGPRGCRVIVEPARDTPLAWFTVTLRGGAAADPPGAEGMVRHMAELARRGTASRGRTELDDAVDRLGAALEAYTLRDSVTFSGTALSRHLDALTDIMAEILAEPAMTEVEHERLLRETRHSLDDIRDDDSLLATRFFDRHCVPGHPYARSVRGTEASLASFDLGDVREMFRRQTAPENLILGFAGDVDDERASELAGKLVAALDGGAAPPPPDVEAPSEPDRQRVILIDKPERTQSQIAIGHLGPRFGTDDAIAMTAIETAFGGAFTSRLMQEIRVKRGWSYGAGCRLYRARAPHWFRISLAPSAEVTPDALELTLSLYRDLAESGLGEDELAFAKSYLAGSIPFVLATPRQRLQVAVSDEVFGLPDGHIHVEADKLSRVTLGQTGDTLARWAHPDRACIILVATADTMVPELERRGFAPLEIIPYDSY